jgi:hypothetical protein
LEQEEDQQAVFDAFAIGPEYQEFVAQDPDTGEPYDNAALVNNIYLNLFGREADEEGLNFYVARLESGEFSHSTIVRNIIDGAQDEDATVMANKLELADYCTQAVADGNLGYTSDQILDARGLIQARIVTETDLEGARADVDEWIGGLGPADPDAGPGYFAINPDNDFWYVDGYTLEGLTVPLAGVGTIYYVEDGELQAAEVWGFDQEYFVELDQTVTIIVPITNTGDEEGTRTITLAYIDDEFEFNGEDTDMVNIPVNDTGTGVEFDTDTDIDTDTDTDGENNVIWSMDQELTLAPGETELLVFNIDTSELDLELGETYTLTLNTGDETQDINLTVVESGFINDGSNLALMGVIDNDDALLLGMDDA